ncbi:MAG: hypothetical protein GX267_10735 [Fibrobacter sp.]|jgi:hypothetical protein|nr:hypothetical protein [Fibrobacter sp.]
MGTINLKWTIEEVSVKGHQACGLFYQYQSGLQARIKAEEVMELETGLRKLEFSRAGQKGNLQGQKSATKSKDAITEELHYEVVDLREMIKAAPNVKQEILKAFGVGTLTDKKGQPKTIAGANLIISGYNKYSEWAQKDAKILEEDIVKVEELRDQLIDADKIQENVKLIRKLGTVEKNTLQSRLEQLITMISVVGIKVFRSSKPELVPLFEALIPGSGTASTENEKEEETVSA